ncbi:MULTISPECIES: methylmalonyl-CoA mutase family protein [unclassified Rhizobium]|uniref:methylmalonyl-CoA mutase family protein n=1 Tax=unclassified Rhizobium TaxID=2613769 RepID=UPI000EA986EE|nr:MULTISPECIES: methylmalonyl-CoA mutase family protein [unclassified Rhizobium]AYG65522.1 methylmalonyl-CoA mutase [Rhizobium sp. CCGE531]AYG72004.1 methylmalonyl-CoA mutase [Rhizobium sp. CCGE532]
MNIDSLDPATFDQTDRKGWLKLVERALKGQDFQETLVSRTDDGIAIDPLYQRRRDCTPLARQRADMPWTVSQRMDDPDVERALAQLGDDLANGATGISLVSKSSASAFGTGLDAQAPGFSGALAAAMADRTVALRFDGFEPGSIDALTAALPDGTHALHIGIDAFSASGEQIISANDIKSFAEREFPGTIVNADGRVVHNAGGTEAQELAVMAASLVGHLRLLDKAGLSPEAALRATSLCLSADQNQFTTMAKTRAARLIFARIAEACGVPNRQPAHLLAETSYRMLTHRDPETNILRNTIAVFSAGVGGADEISVLPHSLTHGIPDPLARRLARNTQTILMAESHLDHVVDPAAGAGGIEALTDALAERAWDIFTDIESKGGLAKVIASGELAAMVAEARAGRAAGPIVGTTLFAMKTERLVTVLGALGPVAGGMGLMPVRLDAVVEG